jgi:hypothetical protein
MTLDQIAGAVGKTLGIFKDLPAWFLSGLTCAAAILLLVPWITIQLPPEVRPYLPYLWVIVVLCGCLALFKWLAVGIDALRNWRDSNRPKKTFHLTPISSMWHLAKQTDGSTLVQIVADLRRC